MKQENVFIDTDGHIVLGDFSLTWLFSDCARGPETHSTRGRVGTPAFSSPEVFVANAFHPIAVFATPDILAESV